MAPSQASGAASSTNGRRQMTNNPFAGIEGFFEGQAEAQASALRAAFGPPVASKSAEHGAASVTPAPSAAAKTPVAALAEARRTPTKTQTQMQARARVEARPPPANP